MPGAAFALQVSCCFLLSLLLSSADQNSSPQDETLTWLREIKQCTPDKLAKWAEMLEKLSEDGTIRTAGGAAAIFAEADRYDAILDPFKAAERSY